MLEILIAVMSLISGMFALILSSEKVIEHSTSIASILRIAPIMIGLVIVALGTDLPEITNSIISSARGYGDINVGDSFGSILAQIALIVGLYAFVGGEINVKRKEIIVMGICEVLLLTIALFTIRDGYISRLDAAMLVIGWPVAMLISNKFMKKELVKTQYHYTPKKLLYHALILFLGFIGIAVGSYVVVESVISLSTIFRIHQYIISFFVVAIGTSLPELAVDLAAIRKKQYDIAIGDTIGSCIVDASLSVGIGPLLFPTVVSAGLVKTTGLYILFVSIMILTILALRKKIDKNLGIFFIILYLLSYVFLFLR